MTSGDKAGIYVTIIVHLSVLIVLLCAGIWSVSSTPKGMLIDFSAQEEAQKREEKARMEEEISSMLDRMIAGQQQPPSSSREIRNMAVDASLKDSKGTDAEKLYEEARKLQEELRKNPQNGDDYADLDDSSKSESKKEDKVYSGPSVVSYNLEGRKASRLAIPAYKCLGGGDVAVSITVDNSGKVLKAEVIDSFSSTDSCLRDYARKAALASRFSVSTTAPARQKGDILYRFIAQ